MKDLMRDLLEEQILQDAVDGDTTVFAELLSLVGDKLIYDSLDDENQDKVKSYHEIHVKHGKEGYSFAVIVPYDMEEQRIIDIAIEQDLFSEEDDNLYVDYVDELTFDEWNLHFNFQK